MEIAPLSEALKQFGPYGVCLLLMALGLVHFVKKNDQIQVDTRAEFLAALREQRVEHTASLRQVTSDFKEAMSEQGKRIDGLAAKIENIDEHVQALRIKG